ncbi:Type I restriction-modification system, DNA-methyltransferase subunit M [methanotrophic endosymbiont of Bathymodiolus azoricus (Menez Gwen)]|nr:Type I restriction-modification system, DNA-methyltransferase subunit M [methanotrophic endosymbiont of Bathymodiolus azoricus (Menez Gwen)]
MNKKGKVLIINAVKEVRQDKNIAFLEPQHIERIYQAYKAFQDQSGFCKVVSIDEVLNHNASLNMALYVSNVNNQEAKVSLDEALVNWTQSSTELKKSMEDLFKVLS